MNNYKLKIKLEKFSIPEPNTGCILWIGSKNEDGYGALRHNKKCIKAHRASWLINKGQIPYKFWILHKCDVPACINIEHLFLGDAKINVQDKMNKGRHKNGSLRKEFCVRGHKMQGENLYYKTYKNGLKYRVCGVCRKIQYKKDALKKKIFK